MTAVCWQSDREMFRRRRPKYFIFVRMEVRLCGKRAAHLTSVYFSQPAYVQTACPFWTVDTSSHRVPSALLPPSPTHTTGGRPPPTGPAAHLTPEQLQGCVWRIPVFLCLWPCQTEMWFVARIVLRYKSSTLVCHSSVNGKKDPKYNQYVCYSQICNEVPLSFQLKPPSLLSPKIWNSCKFWRHLRDLDANTTVLKDINVYLNYEILIIINFILFYPFGCQVLLFLFTYKLCQFFLVLHFLTCLIPYDIVLSFKMPAIEFSLVLLGVLFSFSLSSWPAIPSLWSAIINSHQMTKPFKFLFLYFPLFNIGSTFSSYLTTSFFTLSLLVIPLCSS